MDKKVILKVYDELETIRLGVRCTECQKWIVISEDDGYCPMCFEEIEQLNIQTWEEYYKDKK